MVAVAASATAASSSPPGKPPHFCIKVCIFPRKLDPFFHIPELNSIQSVADQSYPHWTLVVNGDGLDHSQLSRAREMLERSGMPRHRWVLRNTPKSQVERLSLASATDSQFIWYYGGAGCSNNAFDSMMREPGECTHLAGIDDDDVWLPHHLAAHAETYRDVPDAGFVYSISKLFDLTYKSTPSMSTLKLVPKTLRVPGNNSKLYLLPPLPCHLSTSAFTLRMDHPVAAIRGRTSSQQQFESPKRKKKVWSPFMHCAHYEKGALKGQMQGDLDYYDQVWDMESEGRLKSLALANVTMITHSPTYKKGYLSLFRQAYCASDPLTRWSSTKLANASSVHRMIEGRRERLHRLFWAHDETGRPMTDSLPWTPRTHASSLLDHPDYAKSLEAYREVSNWLQVRPPHGDTGGAELLHILRPMLDLACRGNSSRCNYVEVGKYCGTSLALALTYPHLRRAASFNWPSQNPREDQFRRRLCVDLVLNSTSFLGDKRDWSPPAMERPKEGMPLLDARDHSGRYDKDLSQRLKCIAPQARASLITVPPPQYRWTMKKTIGAIDSISVLLLGAVDKVTDLRYNFHQLVPYVRVGGVVLIDEYLTNPKVREVVDDDERGVAVVCKQDFHCVGAVSNLARASSSWREDAETLNGGASKVFDAGGHVPTHNGVYILVRMRAGAKERGRDCWWLGFGGTPDCLRTGVLASSF